MIKHLSTTSIQSFCEDHGSHSDSPDTDSGLHINENDSNKPVFLYIWTTQDGMLNVVLESISLVHGVHLPLTYTASKLLSVRPQIGKKPLKTPPSQLECLSRSLDAVASRPLPTIETLPFRKQCTHHL
ncbi:hypothetical protein CDAR_390451 [Caerostris darwini]|uniref:Uncharacterized protein n=1 Tax=Caerostris darwini TaxID=1538125 RepID=A0AAV4NXZ8_9ARAC|nr:hypothetical protein CDAR_390451 [Caerostris darwini]